MRAFCGALEANRLCRVSEPGRIASPGTANIAAIAACRASRPTPSWPDSNRSAILTREAHPRIVAMIASALHHASRLAQQIFALIRERHCHRAQLAWRRKRCSESPQRYSCRCQEAQAHPFHRAEKLPHASRRFPAPRAADYARGCSSRAPTTAVTLLPAAPQPAPEHPGIAQEIARSRESLRPRASAAA